MPQLKALRSNCVICVDNTWASGASFNPFNFGADVVLESMAKYISGGTHIGGFCLGFNSDIMQKIIEWAIVFGQHVSPDTCQHFCTQLDSIHTRLALSSTAVKTVIDTLTTIPNVKVEHPHVSGHPIYKTHFKYAPGVCWIHVPTLLNKTKIVKILKESTNYETSYGGAHLRVDPWPEIGDDTMYGNIINSDTLVAPKRGVWVRIAVGYDDDDDDIAQKVKSLVKKLKNE